MNLSFFDKELPETEKILGLVSLNLVPAAGNGIADSLEPVMKVLVYAGQFALLVISFIYIKRRLPKSPSKKRKTRKKIHEK
jgi:hypothetical protein